MRITILAILLLAAPALAETLVTRPPGAAVVDAGSGKQIGTTPWTVALAAGTWHLRLQSPPYDSVDLTLRGAPGQWSLEHPDDDTGVLRTESLGPQWTQVLPATIHLRSVPSDAQPLLQLSTRLPGAVAGPDETVVYEGVAVPVVPLRKHGDGFILPRAADRQRLFLRHAGFVDTPLLLLGPNSPRGLIWLTPRYGPFSYWPVDAALLVVALALWRRPKQRPVVVAEPSKIDGLTGATLTGESGHAFTILGTLGYGGMGTVYEAASEEGDRFAVKVIYPHLMIDEEARRRFAQEVAICSRLTHSGLVKLVDWGMQPHPFMAMEKVAGPDLRQILADRGPLPAPQAVAWVVQILRALQVVHRAGILHRDIKPANVMLSSRGVPLLMDFGLACHLEGTHFTRSSVLLGTPLYMAPEQFASEPVSPATDVYSVGVLLYHMLSGEFPHEGSEEIWILMGRVITQPATPITQYVTDLDRHVESVVMRMLARDPAERYADAGAAADALAEWPTLEGG